MVRTVTHETSKGNKRLWNSNKGITEENQNNGKMKGPMLKVMKRMGIEGYKENCLDRKKWKTFQGVNKNCKS